MDEYMKDRFVYSPLTMGVPLSFPKAPLLTARSIHQWEVTLLAALPPALLWAGCCAGRTKSCSASSQRSVHTIQMPDSIYRGTDMHSQLHIQRSGSKSPSRYSWEFRCVFSLERQASGGSKLKGESLNHRLFFKASFLKRYYAEYFLNMHFD